MDTVILRKACGCLHATASGPRLKQVTTFPAQGQVQVTFKIVGFGCDRCDLEWDKEIQPAPNDPPVSVILPEPETLQ